MAGLADRQETGGEDAHHTPDRTSAEPLGDDRATVVAVLIASLTPPAIASERFVDRTASATGITPDNRSRRNKPRDPAKENTNPRLTREPSISICVTTVSGCARPWWPPWRSCGR